MSAHCLHHLVEEDKLDGKKAIIMTHPWVVVWEDKNTETYDWYKVWAKAVDCLEEVRQ
jgi:hypothetical protein